MSGFDETDPLRLFRFFYDSPKLGVELTWIWYHLYLKHISETENCIIKLLCRGKNSFSQIGTEKIDRQTPLNPGRQSSFPVTPSSSGSQNLPSRLSLHR